MSTSAIAPTRYEEGHPPPERGQDAADQQEKHVAQVVGEVRRAEHLRALTFIEQQQRKGRTQHGDDAYTEAEQSTRGEDEGKALQQEKDDLVEYILSQFGVMTLFTVVPEEQYIQYGLRKDVVTHEMYDQCRRYDGTSVDYYYNDERLRQSDRK